MALDARGGAANCRAAAIKPGLESLPVEAHALIPLSTLTSQYPKPVTSSLLGSRSVWTSRIVLRSRLFERGFALVTVAYITGVLNHPDND